jgi:hypothetical protein
LFKRIIYTYLNKIKRSKNTKTLLVPPSDGRTESTQRTRRNKKIRNLCDLVIVEKYKKCNKNNPLTPILKDEGGRMMKKQNFILHP